jgi:uncharacterized protein YggU (UPF0235/DUF167 family)
MIAVERHAEGAILPVRAQPGARRNGLGGEHDGHLKVSVTQAAEKGKANLAIIKVLCDQLNLRKSQIELLGGETASRKRFLVRGIAADDLLRRIAATTQESIH